MNESNNPYAPPQANVTLLSQNKSWNCYLNRVLYRRSMSAIGAVASGSGRCRLKIIRLNMTTTMSMVQLARAAAAYAAFAGESDEWRRSIVGPPREWPWGIQFWRPKEVLKR